MSFLESAVGKRWSFLEHLRVMPCPTSVTVRWPREALALENMALWFIGKEGACTGGVMPGKGCSRPIHTQDSCHICPGTSLRPLTVPAGTGGNRHIAPVPATGLKRSPLAEIACAKTNVATSVIRRISLLFPERRS